jgi:Cu(I)/Ag(I) efflux system membrane protein CusA/SilA
MIARLIAWSARNLVLVLVATAFVSLAGVFALRNLPLDAIPDLSDTQVIIFTEFPGQAPQVVEDQVTYPLTTAMLTVPRSRVVRGFSFFGVSFVYVIFEEGTDIYWARSRVLEYLNTAAKRLPSGVTPALGPDATGVGWVYQYAVLGKNKSLAELRSLQDWDIRFGLAKAEGVAEVASVGGFVKQYNVVVDPGRMRSLGIPLAKVRDAIRQNNMDVGGRTVELSEHEFMVRGRGYIKNIGDIERTVVKADGGTPVLLKDIARVEVTPDERRGITELSNVSAPMPSTSSPALRHVWPNLRLRCRPGCRSCRSMTAPISYIAPSTRCVARCSRKASWLPWSASLSCSTSAALWSPY